MIYTLMIGIKDIVTGMKATVNFSSLSKDGLKRLITKEFSTHSESIHFYSTITNQYVNMTIDELWECENYRIWHKLADKVSYQWDAE